MALIHAWYLAANGQVSWIEMPPVFSRCWQRGLAIPANSIIHSQKYPTTPRNSCTCWLFIWCGSQDLQDCWSIVMENLPLGCSLAIRPGGTYSRAFLPETLYPRAWKFSKRPSVAYLHSSSVVKVMRSSSTHWSRVFGGYSCLNSNRSALRVSSNNGGKFLNLCGN